ncbi:hypothetical protein [Streptomyces palmae]|uniref:Uncharacterized protein n=1 Tax=Streptomyces palmae TaxID=1701085 RepID=A0A4Z0HHF4_9ACTN|nr:hypothetical protein [Streptomyces palmae]TGB19598.1 hypothetical protein E4099_00135 [Streptomyces palmae]
MTAASTLLVPMSVEARVTLTAKRKDPILRWRPDFDDMLTKRIGAEPPPYEDNAKMTADDDGIWLHWLLPEALRRSRPDPRTGRPVFPLVPNRWLVARHAAVEGGGTAAAAWVVESDSVREEDDFDHDVDPDREAARYATLDDEGRLQAPRWIGKAVRLSAQSWTEPREDEEQFLTAVGPALPAFAVFQPFNTHVFSLHDRLLDIAPEKPASVSYAVAGWYSSADDDILGRYTPPELGWQAPQGTEPSRSVFTGTALALPWDRKNAPPDRTPDGENVVKAALGNSASDALQALCDELGHGSTDEAHLLTALQHGLLGELDAFGATEGARHRLHDEWFTNTPAGHAWKYAEEEAPAWGTAPAAGSTARDRITADDVRKLNAIEEQLQEAQVNLAAFQTHLYHLWWMANLPTDKHKTEQEKIKKQLDPTVGTTVAGQVTSRAQRVKQLRETLPVGEDMAHLPLPGVLRRLPRGYHHQPSDPVVLLCGSRGRGEHVETGPLRCRTADTLVKRISIKGKWVSPTFPTSGWDKLPAIGPGHPAAADVCKELLLLHRACHEKSSAPQTYPTLLEELCAKADLADGTMPALTQRWTAQPWSPLYLLWTVNVYALPYPAGQQGSWHLRPDGTFTWKKKEEESAIIRPPVREFSGRAFLSDQVPQVLQGQLEHYSDGLAGEQRQRIRDTAYALGCTDLLSQTLKGLHDWLLLRGDPTHAMPHGYDTVERPEIADLVTDAHRTIPDCDASRTFQPLRAAQAIITRLTVVDRFGRAQHVITPNNHRSRQLAISRALKPDDPLITDGRKKYFELPPRLLQHARLRFDHLSAHDDTRPVDPMTDLADQPTPVIGWLLVNRLANSLLVHHANGTPLGELSSIVSPQGTREVSWRNLPFAPDINESTDPHLHAFVNRLRKQSHDALTALIACIDNAAWTTASGTTGHEANLTLLLGRPLALLRARLRGELAGPPVIDPHWNTITPPVDGKPPFTAARFPVRLGSMPLLSDGLVGYFHGRDYSRLYVVDDPPQDSDGYLSGAGTDNNVQVTFTPPPEVGNAPDWPLDARVTLLADPFAAAHATTDVVPTVALTLPSFFTEPFLHNEQAFFQLNPMLAGLVHAGELSMPQPAAWTGQWSWTEPRADRSPAWAEFGIHPLDNSAHLSDATPDSGRPAARDGFLHLRHRNER